MNAISIQAQGKALHVRVTGKLTKESYLSLAPEIDRQIQKNGKLRILLELHDFHGWTVGALWEDLKFDWKHWRDIDKLAIVGEKAWEKGMAVFCKPFTSATVQYFDRKDLQAAKKWIRQE